MDLADNDVFFKEEFIYLLKIKIWLLFGSFL